MGDKNNDLTYEDYVKKVGVNFYGSLPTQPAPIF